MHTRTKRLLTAVLTLALVFGLALTAWAVDSVTITGDDQSVEIGDSKTLAATVTGSSSDDSVTWASSDDAVADINTTTGVLDIKTAGTTTITATSVEDTDKKDSITLTVYARVNSADVSISGTSTTLGQGQSIQLTARVGTTGANPNFVWTVDSTNLATVDETGKVTVKANATAGQTVTVTATTVGTTDGTDTVAKTYAIAVTAGPTKVELDVEEFTIDVSETKQLTVTKTPSGALTDYTWTSSDTAIATVDADGKVTGVKVGTATITVTSSNGQTATCEATIMDSDEFLSVPDISFGEQTYGYSSKSQQIVITNNTTSDIVIESVELAGGSVFSIDRASNREKDRTVEAGDKNTNWTVVLSAGQPAKTFTDTIRVYGLDENDDKVLLTTAEVRVVVTVPKYLTAGGSSMISTGGKGIDATFASFITGYPDNTFKPTTTITREQFIAILFRLHAAGDEASYRYTSASFNDVATNRWSYQAMEWAAQSGVFPADSTKMAYPTKALTRGEMAELLARVEGWSAVSDTQFPDINNHTNELAIRKAVQAGVFQGYPDGTFRPDGESTRAEAVAALIRYIFGGEPTDAMLSGKSISFTDVTSSHWAYRYVVLAVNGYNL